jgi:hypothetical protein
MQDSIREWLTALGTIISALFAGLIWWMARKNLAPYMELSVDGPFADGALRSDVNIKNSGNRPIVIEAISVTSPLSLLVNNTGSIHASTVGRAKNIIVDSCSTAQADLGTAKQSQSDSTYLKASL